MNTEGKKKDTMDNQKRTCTQEQCNVQIYSLILSYHSDYHLNKRIIIFAYIQYQFIISAEIVIAGLIRDMHYCGTGLVKKKKKKIWQMTCKC